MKTTVPSLTPRRMLGTVTSVQAPLASHAPVAGDIFDRAETGKCFASLSDRLAWGSSSTIANLCGSTNKPSFPPTRCVQTNQFIEAVTSNETNEQNNELITIVSDYRQTYHEA
jgi:hypothetical protein